MPTRTGAKAPAMVAWGLLKAREIPYKAPHQMRPNPVLQWAAAPPKTVAQNCHTAKGIVFCVRQLSESTSAQLRSWRQDIAVICRLANTDSAERAALRKHSSTALDTAWAN